MHALIVANGTLNADARLRGLWQGGDLRIAANGGARHAREHLGMAPRVVIGDFDSLDGETRAWLEQQGVEFIQHPRAKDQTDLELAVDLAFQRGAKQVTVLGAFGRRVDQFVGNVLLLSRVPGVRLMDAAGEMWAATGHATIEGAAGDTVSLIPLDERVEGIVTRALEYPLRGEGLVRGSTRGISNRLTASLAEVDWQKGMLLVVHLFDRPAEPPDRPD